MTGREERKTGSWPEKREAAEERHQGTEKGLVTGTAKKGGFYVRKEDRSHWIGIRPHPRKALTMSRNRNLVPIGKGD